MKKQKIKLKSYISDDVLFEGYYASVKLCVEEAVAQGVPLDGIDLSHANLANANLDDAQMTAARFCGANLNGANLSEAVFDYANFSHADLSYCCFVAASLHSVNFSCASFASTDVTDSVMSRCQFSCPSVFGTLFHRTALFKNNVYYCDKGMSHKMESAPVSVVGLPQDIVYLDDAVKIGPEFILKKDIADAGLSHLKFLYGDIIARFLMVGTHSRVVEKV
ncbi:MAG: hypothetical protein COB76_01405 [Alphaproteobacteria bacterium]|nr:MAG: hypothetical protein COB76_01405 [Alphaproteobacteria bacterium]